MDYLGRLTRAREEMRKRGIGMMFLPYGANLWYLTGVQRREPQLTDMNSYGDYISGAYIGAEDGLTLVITRMSQSFIQGEAVNKPWIEQIRVIDESESPDDVLAEVLRPFNLKDKGI